MTTERTKLVLIERIIARQSTYTMNAGLVVELKKSLFKLSVRTLGQLDTVTRCIWAPSDLAPEVSENKTE